MPEKNISKGTDALSKKRRKKKMVLTVGAWRVKDGSMYACVSSMLLQTPSINKYVHSATCSENEAEVVFPASKNSSNSPSLLLYLMLPPSFHAPFFILFSHSLYFRVLSPPTVRKASLPQVSAKVNATMI